MYNIVENYETENSFVENLNLSKLAKFVLENEDVQENACASLNFISASSICELNNKYRDINKPTDVLSFECDGVEDDKYFIQDDSYELGDIFICVEVAETNAKKFNTNLESELKLLVVHGMLHLCGYDHIKDEDAAIMEAKEEEILDNFLQLNG